MKKIFLWLVFLSFNFILYAVYASNQLREDFKNQLYTLQKGLLRRKQYNAFIDPFLQEAERTSKISYYCSTHPHSHNVRRYFQSLIDYNVVCFYNYVRPTSAHKRQLEHYGKRLLEAITHIHQESDCPHFNVQEEYQQTKDLFLKANKEYYKKLSVAAKLIVKSILLLGLQHCL